MSIEKGRVSSSQLMFMVIGLIQGSIITLSFLYGVTKQNTWVVMLTGLFISLIMIYIYVTIMNIFPQRNIIEINNIVFGEVIGKIISIFYIIHFFFIIPRNLRLIGDFSTLYLLIGTPFIVIIAAFTLICAYAVRNGIEVIARCTVILVIIIFLISFVMILLLLKDMRFDKFLPLFQFSLKEFIQGNHIMLTVPFSEVCLFFMIAPYTNKITEVKNSILYGTIIGGIYILIITIRNMSVLGILAYNDLFPTYQVARIINIGNIITRMEVLVAMILFFSLFTKICLFYYASLLSIAEFFKLKTYKALVFPCGIIIICISTIIYNNPVEHLYIDANVYPVYSFPTVVLIPIITLIVAKVRNLPKIN